MKTKDLFNSAARFIVRARVVFVLLFAALLVFSIFSCRWVKVENEITNFLSEEAEARRGLTIMEEEFSTYGTSKVMVKGVSLQEAEALHKQLAAIPDVLLVQFDETELHYTKSCALFDVTFSDVTKSETSEKALAAVESALKDYDVTVYSDVGFSRADIVAKEMSVAVSFFVVVVLIVLVLTSSTYAEIPVLLLTFIAAAVINLGTAFLLGTISFISSSVAIVMQLALSLDYAIIFCNRYKEEHQKHDVREAVELALAASIPEVAAGSLTTIAGLTAMTFMQFELGADLGLNLIKAIVISLLSVFLLMPALLVFFGKAMDKTKHRSFIPRVSFLGRAAFKLRVVTPILLLALTVGAYLLNNRIDFAYSVDIMPSMRQAEHAAARMEIREVFGANNIVAVFVPAGDYETEKALLEELEARSEVRNATGLSNIEAIDGYRLGDDVDAKTFAKLAGVDMSTARALFAYYAAGNGAHKSVLNNLNSYKAPLIDLFLFLHDAVEEGRIDLAPDQTALVKELFGTLNMVRRQLVGEQHSRIVLDLYLPVQSEETFAFLDELHSITARYYGQPAVLTGDSVSAADFRESFVTDKITVSVLSIVMVMLILFFSFRSIAMPLLLILVIQGSIWINFGIAALRHAPVFFMCYLIVGAMQMGANIDYAIVVSTRYRGYRVAYGRKGAIIQTMNIAFPTIMTSGLIMMSAGFLIGFFNSEAITSGIGMYVGTGTAISLLLTLFALPQVLVLADRFIITDSAESRQRKHSALSIALEGKRRALAAGSLAVALVLALAALPFGVIGAKNHSEETQQYTAQKLAETERLRELAQKLEAAKDYQNSLAYGFAEQYMTDQIGSEQLLEGYAQYAEGLEAYNAGKAQYDEGAAQLADAENAYYAGKERLEAGQAQYEAGVAARDRAAQQLAEGQAQYDEGMAEYQQAQADLAAGQAEYDAGLAQYNSAKASLDAVSPLYQSALAARNRVNELQVQYNEAVANGDTIQALAISGMLTGARAAADATNFDSLLAQYESAQAELAAAEAQLNEGKAKLDAGYAELAAAEAKLNEGKAQLDAGYAQLGEADAQLAQGKAQLDAGRAELNAGGAEIDKGYAQLKEAETQLKEGEEALNAAAAQLLEGMDTLAENREELNESILALDALTEAEAQLDAGLDALRAEPGLSSALRRNAGALDTLEAADAWLKEHAENAQRQEKTAMALAVLLALAAVTALAALLLSMKLLRLPAVLGGLAALFAAVSCVLLRSRCPDLSPWMLLAGALLTVAAAVFMTQLMREKRTTG